MRRAGRSGKLGCRFGNEGNGATDELEGIGARLRAIRESRHLTLRSVSEESGISVSTLSRLESGARRAQLELLLPLARIYRLPLDDLVGAPRTGDPRIHSRPVLRNGVVTLPLSGGEGPWRAFKQLLPATPPDAPLTQRVHPGWDWLYVISGRLRLVLADDEQILEAGEAAEFDTHVPQAFANPGPGALEVLCLFNTEGARMHTRASPSADDDGRIR